MGDNIKNKKNSGLLNTVLLFLMFALFTVLVMNVDVAPAGFTQTPVGFSSVNDAFSKAIGFSDTFYKISQFCGLVGIAIAFCFAMCGLSQWIKRKSLLKVDCEIIAMGFYYIIVLAFYALFLKWAVNYRPVFVNNELEASYPSSHTMLALTVVIGLMKYTNFYAAEEKKARILYLVASYAFIAIAIVTRVFSGVHWLTDIIASLLLSAAVASCYEPLNVWVYSVHGKIEAKLSEKLK